MPAPPQIAIFASHDGSNAQAVIDACESGAIPGSVVVVISNNSKAVALERARGAGIATRHLSAHTHPVADDLDGAILDELRGRGVNLVVLAGYLKKLGPRTLRAFEGRIVNVHPALLPKYGGQGMFGRHVHEAVVAGGESVSGASVHLVDEDYDHGEVIAQREVPVLPGDTPDTLAARVLPVEHELLVDTLARVARGDLLGDGTSRPGR